MCASQAESDCVRVSFRPQNLWYQKFQSQRKEKSTQAWGESCKLIPVGGIQYCLPPRTNCFSRYYVSSNFSVAEPRHLSPSSLIGPLFHACVFWAGPQLDDVLKQHADLEFLIFSCISKDFALSSGRKLSYEGSGCPRATQHKNWHRQGTRIVCIICLLQPFIGAWCITRC
jgi:hypothetical protein